MSVLLQSNQLSICINIMINQPIPHLDIRFGQLWWQLRVQAANLDNPLAQIFVEGDVGVCAESSMFST